MWYGIIDLPLACLIQILSSIFDIISHVLILTDIHKRKQIHKLMCILHGPLEFAVIFFDSCIFAS